MAGRARLSMAALQLKPAGVSTGGAKSSIETSHLKLSRTNPHFSANIGHTAGFKYVMDLRLLSTPGCCPVKENQVGPRQN